MSYYYQNRKRAQTINNQPSETEQSLAKDTDINVIVKKFATTGTVPVTKEKPIYGDFTDLPRDLRGMIEKARDLKNLRGQLPPGLKDMPVEELLALTPDKLASILTPPPADKPTHKQEEKK